jgi:hypothetical protein
MTTPTDMGITDALFPLFTAFPAVLKVAYTKKHLHGHTKGLTINISSYFI